MHLYLIRHAHAGSRSAWDGPDGSRPLSDKGQAQAVAISERLATAGIDLLLSSPATRCVQTLEPLAGRVDRPVAPTRDLAEGVDGPPALDALLEAVGTGRIVAACSHGDVLPAVVATAVRRGADLEGPRALTKASWWECTVADGQIARIVHVPTPEI